MKTNGAIKIDKDIPLPPRARYPFAEMQVGESFLVPTREDYGKLGRSYWSRKLGHQYKTRQQPDGSIRIWRVA